MTICRISGSPGSNASTLRLRRLMSMRPMWTMLKRAVMIMRQTPSSTPIRTLTGNIRYVSRNRLPLGEKDEIFQNTAKTEKAWLPGRKSRVSVLLLTCCPGPVSQRPFWWNRTCWWCAESARPRWSSARKAWKHKTTKNENNLQSTNGPCGVFNPDAVKKKMLTQCQSFWKKLNCLCFAKFSPS